MRKLLLIIDVQNGFVNKQNEWLPAKLAAYIRASDYTDVFAISYVNAEGTACYKRLGWRNCMTKEEQAICPELDGLYSKVYTRSTYNSLTMSLGGAIAHGNYDQIDVVGMSATRGVLATAYELFDMGYNVYVIPALCADATEQIFHGNIPCLDIPDIPVEEKVITLKEFVIRPSLLMPVIQKCGSNYQDWFKENFPNGAKSEREILSKL